MKCLLAALVACVGLAGCGGRTPAPADAGAVTVGDAGYLAPPRPDDVRLTRTGLRLSGSAPAGGRVRLATPGGEALFADADAAGRWTITLADLETPRIFGLSVKLKDISAQAEGYVVVTPQGQVALLRAGAGAVRIDPPRAPGVRAIDFDRGGGVEVSTSGPPGAATLLHFDGRLAAQGRTDAAGRYEASLPAPGSSAQVRPGPHRVQISGDGFSDEVAFVVSPAAPLADGPVRSQVTDAGLRLDWMTPGGGVQSTILVH